MRKKTEQQPNPKPFEPKRIFDSIRYPFSEAEIRQLGADLAHATREAIDIERAKKVAMAAIAADKKDIESKCASLSLKIENGYEMREMECIVHFGAPRSGRKEIFRADNGEFVRDEPMTPEEMQAAFDFPDDKGKTQ
jgi:hypothetical protein